MKRTRRDNGLGCIRQRDNGTYELGLFIGYHEDGRKKMKYFYGKTKSDVNRQLQEYVCKKESGIADSDYTFSKFADQFLDLHKHRVKPVTHAHYLNTLRIINEEFADRRLDSIKPMEVEAFLIKLKTEGRSDSAVSHARGLFYMIMEAAEANDYIKRNPVRYAGKIKKDPPKKKDVFTAEEVRAILEGLDDSNIFHLGVKLLLCSGLRSQELLALRPEDISDTGDHLVVVQAVSMVRGTATISTTKSYASMRRVPLPKKARKYALLLKQTNKKYIFAVGRDDVPCNPTTFRKAYREALESLPGVRYLSPHSTRHTYVSMLFSAGVPLSTIQAVVGHTTTIMTEHYLTIENRLQNEAVEKLDNVIFKEV